MPAPFSQRFNSTRLDPPHICYGIGRGKVIFAAPHLGTCVGCFFLKMPIQGIFMPRRRTPADVARITGADRLHPGRHAARSVPKVQPLGNPPDALTAAEKRAWKDFADDMPWLARSDRHLVGIAARLAVLIQKGGAPLAAFTQMRLCLSSMGGTPTDRTKVITPDGAEDDPAERFFQ